ncbi:MAG TPA: fumarylacetoacetate hydrolase family protein [Steroidobacteraceae bacterium]|jgi:2-keto-4-pentenoate hydratase/2-oxohepta-3-ene-1,7-dioic acid hydratase in catechol pathway
MRLASFAISNRASWGVVEGEALADVGAVLKSSFADLRAAIAGQAYGEIREALSSAERFSTAAVTWLPVIPNPDKILCIGLNYEEHRQETGRPKMEYPTVFVRLAGSQNGHLQDVPRPLVSTELDYEGELAVIIGKGGRYITRRDALAHIAGYACYNDISVRDWQRHTQQFTPGKNFPGTGPFGPWMVTVDELPDIAPLRLQTRVNGTVVQSATFSQMIFDVPRLIEYCSTFTRLEPGDVIVTGTPGGVGSRRQPPLWLKPGDVTEVEIERVGLLRNRIVAEAES